MSNNYFKLGLLLSLLFFISSCLNGNMKNGQNSVSVPQHSATFKRNHNIVEVSLSDYKYNQKLKCSYIPNQEKEIIINERTVLDFDKILRDDSENSIAIAYNIHLHQGKLPIKISINGEDYSFEYVFKKLTNNNHLFANTDSDLLLPLKRKIDIKKSNVELKRWLYHNNIQLDEWTISDINNIVSNMSSKSINEFACEEENIPTYKDLKGLSIPIKTNSHYDYYYLFATDNDNEIDEFISEVVANDFVNGESNISKSLSCFRLKGKDGLLTVFFVGINRDWNKFVYPIGLTYIDNSGPLIIEGDMPFNSSTSINSTSNYFRKSTDRIKKFSLGDDDYYIHFPNLNFSSDYLTVKTGDFYGNNANFIFGHKGDVKNVVITYNGVTKNVDIYDKPNPYSYNCRLPLNIGDNYVTINAYDSAGNKSTHNYLISMVKVEDNTQDIIIDNNITIFN